MSMLPNPDRPCVMCHRTPPEASFRINNRGHRLSHCNDCAPIYQKAWRAGQDAERLKTQRRKYKNTTVAYRRAYYAKNKDRILEVNRKYRERYIKEHPEYNRSRVHRYKAIKRKVPGSWTVQEWEVLKVLFNYSCLRCGRSEPEIKLTADHVIPISMSGSTNFITNIQPLCHSCNSSKGAKYIDYRGV